MRIVGVIIVVFSILGFVIAPMWGGLISRMLQQTGLADSDKANGPLTLLVRLSCVATAVIGVVLIVSG